MPEDLSANIERFTGFADCYDAYRPTPPAAILDMLAMIAQTERPRLVVDLGCGTGLSTCVWSERAEEVVGIEPSADMRHQAEKRAGKINSSTRFVFREGLSTQTGLPDGCTDIVTCSQSLHWMEPTGTFAEAQRILRPGGVFASIDCDWPPIVGWEAEVAYVEFERGVRDLAKKHGVEDSIKRWSKDGHLERIRQSERFRYVREILAHGVEVGNSDRLVGLAMSQGSLQSLLKLGLSEREIGLDRLRESARRLLGDQPRTWYFGYRVRVGVK